MSQSKVSKAPSTSNCHAGHRQRKREQFEQSGLDGFAIHEILEMLLYPAIRRINTNPIAHKLLDTYGTLENLLRHAVEEKPKSFAGQAYLATVETALLTEMQQIPRPDPLTSAQIYTLAVFYLRRYPDQILFLHCSDAGVLQEAKLILPTEEALREQIQLSGGHCHIAAVQDTFSLESLREGIVSEQTKLLLLAHDWSAVWL